MSFFPSSDNPTRRFRSRRDVMRDASPESDMFFESSPAFGLARSHLADRLGSSVFEDFPTRRPLRSFPSHSDTPTFGSLHRHRQHPSNWSAAAENHHGSQESSPTEGRDSNMRYPFFQRSESIPVRVAHESRHGSRSSTPESTGSGHSHASSSHSRPHSNGPDASQDGGSSAYDDNVIPEGVEEHPGVASRTGRPSFTARRQPKVHHIPIHVEPRDGSHPVVLTPPAESVNSRAPPDLAQNRESPSVLPPQQKKTVKQVFAMPMARDTVDSARNSNGNTSSNNSNSSIPEEVSASPTAKDNASKERVVPIAVPETPQQPAPKAASPTTVETEVTVTLPTAADKKKRTAVEVLEEVRLDVERQRKCVEEFAGTRGDKQYLYLDEMLTRDLIKLDNISTDGDDELRKARRAVIVAINGCIQALEQKVAGMERDKAAAKEQNESARDAGDDQQQQKQEEAMDVCKDAGEGTAASKVEDSTPDNAQEPQEAAVVESGSTVQQQGSETQSEIVPSQKEEAEVSSPAEAQAVPMETEVSSAVTLPVETSV